MDKNSPGGDGSPWPVLDYARSSSTLATLQLWTQIVGKARLALTPWLNHGWHVPLYVNARGLGSSAIHVDGGIVEVDFDLVAHRLVIRSSQASERGFALGPMSVAAFYRRFMAELAALGIEVAIETLPNEVSDPIRFPDDEIHSTYDEMAAQTYWRALVKIDRVFRLFRTGFLGKASPVHLFWGALDLAVTRFSGRPAPLHPGGVPGLPDNVTREAYSHEVSSAGFWPGNDAYPQAAFYSYAYPTPPGFGEAQVEPPEANWSAPLGEWLLPYEVVRGARDPETVLMHFLQSTYFAAADLGHWSPALDCPIGVPGVPRAVTA